MNHKELERVFRQWCIKQGLLEGNGRTPTTPVEAEHDLHILEWILDGAPAAPPVAERLAQLRALAGEV